MVDGPLQWFFMFGILQNSVKPPVDLKFRPALEHRFFYQTTEIERYETKLGRIIERQEIESVEKIIALHKTKIEIVNLKAKIEPKNATKLDLLLKRPYFDYLEEEDLSGDLRSRKHPFGYAWMLFPTPSSLMIPDIVFHEGQKWAVKMAGGRFEINYELKRIEHRQYEAYINGENGFCLNELAGNRYWNASWIIDTRSGIIKKMQLDIKNEYDSPKRTTYKTITKVLTREADDETIFDYEIDDRNNDEL